MSSFYSRHYWRIGFQSRLYDLLMPEVYADSLRRVVACAPNTTGKLWLDFGCGSGALIKALESRLREGDRYVGIDRLLPGLINAREKAERRNVASRVGLVQSDLTQPFPFAPDVVDMIVAHFSLYTIELGKRERVLRQFRTLLRPGGILVVVEPSPEYDALRIINESFSNVRERSGIFKSGLKKWLVYPLTYRFGLKFIERQLKNNSWHASTEEALCEEVYQAGFEVKHIEPVYVGSANLLTAGKALG
jgi:ubiquinone/menaquinone biosynthesis C-methylase UbiE